MGKVQNSIYKSFLFTNYNFEEINLDFNFFFFIRDENYTSRSAIPTTVCKANNQSQYRLILPRPPLQQIRINQRF